MEAAQYCEVMTGYGGIAYGSIFTNRDVAAGLDAAVPSFVDIIVDEADVFAAFRALAGLGFRDGLECVLAAEARDFPRRVVAREQAEKEWFWWRLGLDQSEFRLWCHGGRSLEGSLGVATCDSGFAGGARHALAIAYLVVVEADAALGGNHKCRFRLAVSAFGACHLNAMALWLIGHGDDAWVLSDALGFRSKLGARKSGLFGLGLSGGFGRGGWGGGCLFGCGCRCIVWRANDGFADENGTGFHGKGFGLDVADDFCGGFEVNAIGGDDIAVHFAINDDRRGFDFGFYACILAYGEVAIGLDLAFDFAVDDKVVCEFDGAFDFNIRG